MIDKNKVLSNSEIQTFKSMSLYWKEVRGREDTSSLLHEADQVYNQLGMGILNLVEHYIELIEKEIKTSKKIIGEEELEGFKDKSNSDFFRTDKKEVEYKWQRNSVVDGYPKLHITIPCSEEKLKLMFEIEGKMAELGIVFDSGYGEGCRDWEFDWSLQGKHFVFDEKEKKYVEITQGRME